jgi:Transposase
VSGRHYDDATKAAAIEQYYLNAGKTVSAIARDLGVPDQTVRDWIHKYDPAEQLDFNKPTAESLSQLIFDVVVTTLHSLRARAIITGDPEWIARQEGQVIAQLDAAQWDRLIRVVGAFKPREHPELPEPERNGSVDTAF